MSGPVRHGQDTKVSLFALILGLTCGYDATAMAGALLLVTDHFGLTTTQQGSLYAATAAGWILGAVLGSRLVNSLGRRKTLLGLTVLYLVATGLTVTAANPLWLGVGRFGQGTAIGIAIVTTPIFIAESATTRARGRIAVLYQVATSVGIAMGYFGGYFLADSGQWRPMLAIPGVLALAAALWLLGLPETDRWRQLRRERETGSAATRPAGALRGILGPRHRRLTLFVVTLGFFVQATGINAMVFFSPRIFQHIGYTDDFGLLVLPGFVQLAGAAAALVCALTIDRFGRRPVLLTGTALMGMGHAFLVIGFAAGSPGVVGFLGLVTFIVGFNSGFGSLVWVFAAEGFPDHLRGAGASVMLLTNLTTNLFVAQFFLDVLNAIGGLSTFLVLFAITALAWIFVFVAAPETKGRSLDEVQSYWEAGRRWPVTDDTHAAAS
ncbi:MFS transporter [Amycolatopsis decaplanina]|uniref:Sugar-transport integral membrane protein SugI n=1 Tax=Amycolatopsis decaplanina DSM 44594 TaxID=1284240 RepID=M2Z4T6_9PSEU|nr:MFS transporter [Amycolatopsis decaplanina]EME55873.1 sugar-transport integral membrane protein SugI [Amycolatopsis decaplanina DSM 44594]